MPGTYTAIAAPPAVLVIAICPALPDAVAPVGKLTTRVQKFVLSVLRTKADAA